MSEELPAILGTMGLLAKGKPSSFRMHPDAYELMRFAFPKLFRKTLLFEGVPIVTDEGLALGTVLAKGVRVSPAPGFEKWTGVYGTAKEIIDE